MSAYVKNRYVDSFIRDHKSDLIRLKKFNRLGESSHADNFIDMMKITEDNVKMLKTIFDTVIFDDHQMFVHTEGARSQHNLGYKLMEYRLNTADEESFKGTMSFTTCHDVSSERNFGSNYNISVSNVFLGMSDKDIGRLQIYHNKYKLHLLNIGVNNLYHRRVFSYIMTKIILGNDYGFNYQSDNIVNEKMKCEKCPPDCIGGLWSMNGALHEKIINYFMEIYNYDRYNAIKKDYDAMRVTEVSFKEYYEANDKKIEPLDGILINDATIDPLTQMYISGTEARIYIIDLMMELEAILYMGLLYFGVEPYRKAIEANIANSHKNDLKHFEVSTFNIINEMLKKYCSDYRKFTRYNMFSNTSSKLHNVVFDMKDAHSDVTYLAGLHIGGGFDFAKLFVNNKKRYIELTELEKEIKIKHE